MDVIELFNEYKKESKFSSKPSFPKHCDLIEHLILKENIKNPQYISNIEDELVSRRSNTVILIRIYKDFVSFLESKGYVGLYTDIHYNFSTSEERQIEIAKFLHEPRTALDIQLEFNKSRQTIAEDLRSLSKGVNYMGWDLKINPFKEDGVVKSKSASKKYLSTAHPFSMIMNLTEIHALTIGVLDKLDKGSVLYKEHLAFTNKVFTQLSTYAQDILLDSNNGRHDIDCVFELKYVEEEIMLKNDKLSALAYLYKRKFVDKDAFVPITYEKENEIVTQSLFYDHQQGEIVYFKDQEEKLIEININKIININLIERYK
jgi:hypothetical protein